ncbi:hypothetical protein APS56_15320 [Pseudalgibacter alginicilyticus]|uniref:Cell surface protein n=1 Tax=Pseudalgibacter alginicilyticus TaxID=1736674 RepID=A0A0N7HYW9_9FLAO|nr:YncE family protein [Pseudalgibacter alginicilyticus]ALJ06422.1 hypothetical protein APS56_15320 [Pseudalgibacter alginicilyticus]
MKTSFYKCISMLFILFVISISCTSEDRDYIAPLPEGDYSQGVFILNEGGYGYSNASVSFLDVDGQDYSSIFSGVNQMTLGDVAQSIGLYGDNAYIVVNNSATIEIVNRYTFEYITTVSSDIMNPRYIAFEGNKGYITNWGDPNNVADDYVAVLNLETHLVEDKIPVVEGPEKLLIYDGTLYVAHKGGYGWGHTISVIDLLTKNVTSSIPVGDVPDDMLIDDGKLYVISSGKGDYTLDETPGMLHKINISDNSIEKTLTFPEKRHPRFLDINNEMLYYTIDNEVYTISTDDFVLSETPLFSPEDDGLDLLYGFKIHNDIIYLADAKDYVSKGAVFMYNLRGLLQNTFLVQIIPNSFYFNNI